MTTGVVTTTASRARFARPLMMLLRVLAGVQLVVGIGFWSGHWFGLRNFHMTLGSLYVLSLWAIAGIAISARQATALAIFAILWGAVIAAFGAMQQGILIGEFHWVVRIAHLVIAMSAMPLAERLARSAA